MPADDLARSSPGHEIDRRLFLDSRVLKGKLSRHGETVDDFLQSVRLLLLTARREDRPPLIWYQAQGLWLTGEKRLARQAARKYLRSRQPTELDRSMDSARQRFRRRLTAARKRDDERS